MVHPDDSILLAYVRQQRLDQNWQENIHKHVADCEACQKRCKQLRQISTLLEDALSRAPRDRPLLSNIESEWDWVQSPQAAQLTYQRRRQERQREDLALGIALLTRLPLMLLAKMMPVLAPYVRKLTVHERQPRNRAMAVVPVIGAPAAAFLMLLSVMIVLAYTLVVHNPLGPQHTVGTATAGPLHLTPHPTWTPTTVPTQSGKGVVTNTTPIATATATTGSSKLRLFVCMSNVDKAQGRIRICGVGFKPGDKAQLTIDIAGSGFRSQQPVSVDGSGNFQDFWYIYSCKDVPTTIIGQDVEHPSLGPVVLMDIQYNGRCFPNPIPTVAAVHQHH